MPVPKRKTSRRRRDLGRTHYKITPINLVECDHCSELKKQHMVCPKCGYYKGTQVVEGK